MDATERIAATQKMSTIIDRFMEYPLSSEPPSETPQIRPDDFIQSSLFGDLSFLQENTAACKEYNRSGDD